MEANGNRIATFCIILPNVLQMSHVFGTIPPWRAQVRRPSSTSVQIPWQCWQRRFGDLETRRFHCSDKFHHYHDSIMIPSWSMQVLICSFISGTISCSKIFSTHGCSHRSHRSHRSHAMSDLRSRHLPSQQGIYIICWIALAAATVTDLGVQYTCSIIRICSYTLVPYCDGYFMS